MMWSQIRFLMDMFNIRKYHAFSCHVGIINIVLTFSIFSFFSTREIRLKEGKTYENFLSMLVAMHL